MQNTTSPIILIGVNIINNVNISGVAKLHNICNLYIEYIIQISNDEEVMIVFRENIHPHLVNTQSTFSIGCDYFAKPRLVFSRFHIIDLSNPMMFEDAIKFIEEFYNQKDKKLLLTKRKG